MVPVVQSGRSPMAVHELFVYLRAKSAQQAVDFYRNVFGATEKFRLVAPSGRIGHVELALGGTTPMLSDEFPEFDIHAPDPPAPSSPEGRTSELPSLMRPSNPVLSLQKK